MTTGSAETTEVTTQRIDSEREDDQRVDAKALLVIFITLVTGAVYFVSGWTPNI